IDGFIIARLKEPGQTVTQNDVILVMADELIIEANVDETDLRYIRLGQKLKIFLDAYPDKEFYGKIEHIAYKSQTINNVTVYKIKILPLNAPKDFRAGMTATIKVISQKKENVLLLPTNAIIKKDNKKMVIIRSEGPRPEIREVQTGIDNGKKVEIISGISENDTVLIHVSEKKAGQMMGPPSLFGK
ncbi:MAG: HlyD family efflux transporter periplasmic adaptor subunit, partial [Elusimicrobiota bacterium]